MRVQRLHASATAARECNGLQRMGKATARPRRFCPVDGESGNNPRGYGSLRETARAWRGQLGPPTEVSETLIARIDKNRAVVFRYCPSRRREQTEEAACRYRAMLGRCVPLVRDHRPLQAGQRRTRTRMHVASHAIDDHPDGHDKGGHPNRGVCTSNKPSNEL